MAVTSSDVLDAFQIATWQGSDSNAKALALGTKFQAVQEDVVTANADIDTLQAEVVVLQAAAISTRAPVIAATTGVLPACTYANGTLGVGATLTGNAVGALAAQDGVTLTAGQRLLVKDQAAAAQNGVYVVTVVGTGAAAFVLTRATDFDELAEITDGAYFFVGQGTTLGDSAFVMNVNGAITVGTTGIVFVQFSALGQITAGAGLTKTGSTLDVVANADASIVVNASDIQVGVLASDAQHGNRGGGAVHADAIAAGASGFMTGADKTKLDGVEALADVTDETNVLAALAVGATAKDMGGGAVSNVGLVDGVTVSAHAARHAGGGADAIADAIAAGAAGLMTGADKSKLDGIEALADVTDATNVLAALALTAAAKDMGGGAVSNVGLVDGVTVSGHAARHAGGGADAIADAIAAGAAGLMTGADKTKLDGIEALADVTDAANVAAAGAAMAATLASTATGDGASDIGIEDAGLYFAGTELESATQALGLFAMGTEGGSGTVGAVHGAKYLKAYYSFASHGGAQGDIVLASLQIPAECPVTRFFYFVTDAILGGGGAEIAFKIEGAGDLLASAVLGTNGTAGVHDGTVTTPVFTSVARSLTMTVTVADLTAGEAVFWLEYLT